MVFSKTIALKLLWKVELFLNIIKYDIIDIIRYCKYLKLQYRCFLRVLGNIKHPDHSNHQTIKPSPGVETLLVGVSSYTGVRDKISTSSNFFCLLLR